ncbi:MAG: hypothetical protein E7586_02555 [Ruminococcaceae bacterium]|nr:hypothetical protein [Oscillospiraceae bacterium]
MKIFNILKTDKKYIKSIYGLLIFQLYIAILYWIDDNPSNSYIYIIVHPIFSAIYGCTSFLSSKKVIVPNLILVVCTIPFCYIIELLFDDRMPFLSILGPIVSLIFSLLMKLAVYISNKSTQSPQPIQSQKTAQLYQAPQITQSNKPTQSAKRAKYLFLCVYAVAVLVSYVIYIFGDDVGSITRIVSIIRVVYWALYVVSIFPLLAVGYGIFAYLQTKRVWLPNLCLFVLFLTLTIILEMTNTYYDMPNGFWMSVLLFIISTVSSLITKVVVKRKMRSEEQSDE